MADIRINDLPLEGTPSANDFLAVDGASTRKTTVQNAVNSAAPVASQAQAEAGTDNNARMTALSTKQAISYNSVPLSRSVNAGSGLSGGGPLSSDISIQLSASSAASLALANTAIQEGNTGLIPNGGSSGQFLVKNSSSNRDVTWASSASPIYDAIASMSGVSVPSAFTQIRVNGKNTASDGGGGLFTSTNNGSSDTFTSLDGRTWYRVKDVNIDRVAASVANRIIEFDIRDSRFAGGAPWNGVDDDSPAFAAAIAYFKTLNTSLSIYVGKGAARLRLPRGTGVLNSSVDLTAAHNVHIIGEGDGVTTIKVTGNFPAFKSDSTTTSTTVDDSHHRVGLADFCIVGPGRANTNAHGVDFQAMNNGFIRDVRFYSLRDAIRMRNAWQFDITRPKIDGGPTIGGGLTCYNGICLLNGLNKDGTSNNVIENGVKIYGGIISGCENVGFRGESVSGSMVMGLEVLACGQTGVLLGDNPGGKPTKWFTWTGGMIDTCGDLLVIQKGNSSEATEMHFSGLWMGYANAGSGNGDAIRLEGVTKSTFRPDMVANVDTALVAVNCTGITYEAGTIDGYDRSLVGSTGIILQNTVQSKVSAGRATKWPGSPSTIFIAETGSCDFNTITDINCDNGATIIGTGTIGGMCRPFKFKNSGGVDIVSGSSSVVVSHGLVRTPNRGEIQVTPRSTLATSGVNSFAVDTITSTQFTIRTNANVTANTAFDWYADASRG